MIAALLLTATMTPALPCGAPASVVQEPAEEPSVGQLMAGLRARDLKWHERDRLVGELLDRGTEGALPLAKYAADRLRLKVRDWEKEGERYRHEFTEAAEDAIKEGMPRRGEDEIERLRDEALAVTRGQGLTKKRISEEIDPRLARLKELLRIAPREVLDSDEDLDERREELVALADEVESWAHIWRQAAEELADDEEGRGAAALGRIKEPPLPTELLRTMEAEEHWLAQLATPMKDRDRETLIRNRELGAELKREEAAGILYHNLIRIELGLHAQLIDVKLCEAGRGHSEDMRKLGFFAHESPVEGKKTPGDRARLAGTTGGAENIARGQREGRAAVMAWWYSPGHHKNMLGGGTRIGLGRSETFWTEMFG